MFLKNAWYVAGWSHQVPAGKIVARTIVGEPLVLYRTSNGAITVLEDRCCHRFAPLSRGRLEGDDIRCMYHGLKFSPSGTCVEIPSTDRIPTGVAVRENTLGRKSTSWGQTQPRSTTIERGVRVERWLRDTSAASYAPLPDGTRVDQWSAYDFVVPGVFLLRSSGYPAGTAERLPDGPAGLEPLYRTVTSQAVTPITETSTIYCYSGGQLTCHTEAEQLRRQIELFGVAFREDKAMIEAQQAVINRSPDKPMMTLSFDRSVGQFRRLMAALIEAEAPPTSTHEATPSSQAAAAQ